MTIQLESIKRARAGAGALLLLAAAATPVQALEGYTNFDNFDGATAIDMKRWLAPERHRMIEGKALRMIQRELGSQTGNSGVFSSSNSTNMTNPTLITQIKGVITVNAFETTHCAANAEPSGVQARFVAQFFNAGPGVPSSGNRTNDVGATVRLRRESNSGDAPNVLRVQGTVYQCTTSDCNYGSISLGDVDLGTALVGEAVTLQMEWDQPNKRFNFRRGTESVKRVNYAVSDALAPGVAFRAIGTRTTAANCLAGRTTGFMDAKFDDILVNESAAP